MNNFKINISVIVAFLVILLFIFIMYLSLFSKNSTVPVSPLVGKVAPDFILKTFNNESIDFNKLKGKAVVLNFWSSWCVPCKDETKAINRAYLRYLNRDIVFIGVNIWDDDQNAIKFLKTYIPDYKNGYDPKKEIQVNYGIQGIPETFFINKKGIITNRYQGELNDNIINYFAEQVLN